jgi:hypothetical protein
LGDVLPDAGCVKALLQLEGPSILQFFQNQGREVKKRR